MKLFLTLSAAALVLSGCRLTEASDTPPAAAQKVADSFVYTKARNGLCFGVATQTRVSTGGSLTENVLVVNVPCDAVLPTK